MIWTGHDLARLGGLTACYAATGLLPSRWDGAVGDLLFQLARPFLPRRSVARRMSERLGVHLESRNPGDLADDWLRFYMEDAWGRARDLHRRGSALRTSVTGREHIEAALAAGRGAILWVMPFCGSRVFKAALWRDAIRVVHLSRANHGAGSKSWLALRVWSPLYRRSEGRYLADTIVMPVEGFPRVLGGLKAVLRRDGCLSMNSVGPGRREVTVELLSRQIRLATGAPTLAHLTGAALLPAYAMRVGRLAYEAVIEPPLLTDATAPRGDYVARAAQEFAGRVERQFIRRPQDWSAWRASASPQRPPLRGGEPLSR